MMYERFPFAFDPQKMGEMFKMPEFDRMFDPAKMPGMDIFLKAQEKNMAAVIEANKAAIAGYQNVYQRQIALTEEALTQCRERFAQVQAQPASADQARQNADALKSLFDKAIIDLQELSELTQKANTKAFDILKTRFEEALAELGAALEKAEQPAR